VARCGRRCWYGRGGESGSKGCEVGGLRSEPVSSENVPPLLHRAADLLGWVRLLLRACFWGVVSAPRLGAVGSESRDECEVNSESDSVAEEPELAVAFACVGAAGSRATVVCACEDGGAPLFGGANSMVGNGGALLAWGRVSAGALESERRMGERRKSAQGTGTVPEPPHAMPGACSRL
jgi:hypothetical protein